MDKFNRKPEASIVFIPDYILPALKAVGITLEEIAILGNMYYTKKAKDIGSFRIENEKFDSFYQKITGRMSKIEIAEIGILNDLLTKKLFNHDFFRNQRPVATWDFVADFSMFAKWDSSTEIDTNKVNRELINNFSNTNIDASNILMSGNKENELFHIETHMDTMFVIIHEGFTNFALSNNRKSKEQMNIIAKCLLNYMFNSLGESAYYNSHAFQSFMSLKRN